MSDLVKRVKKEVTISLPDMGLKKKELEKLKKAYENKLVETLNRRALSGVVYVVRVRVVIVR